MQHEQTNADKRHGQLFELIRQENQASVARGKKKKAAPIKVGAAEMLQFQKAAMRSLRAGGPQVSA